MRNVVRQGLQGWSGSNKETPVFLPATCHPCPSFTQKSIQATISRPRFLRRKSRKKSPRKELRGGVATEQLRRKIFVIIHFAQGDEVRFGEGIVCAQNAVRRGNGYYGELHGIYKGT